jgi:clan AA aspartic protease
MSKPMGKVLAKFRMWNIADDQPIAEGSKQPHEEECLVDTGATPVVIPPRVADRLNLRRSPRNVPVSYADGRREWREVAIGLRMEFMGRDTECRAIIEPGRDTVLVGQIVLEDMDLLVDCREQKLVPRDPTAWIHEVLAA